MKNKKIEARVSEQDYEKIIEKAKKKGVKISQLVSSSVLNEKGNNAIEFKDEEYKKILGKAKEEGISVNEFILRRVFEEKFVNDFKSINDNIVYDGNKEKQIHFRVNEREYNMFIELTKKHNISITELIISSVFNRKFTSEFRIINNQFNLLYSELRSVGVNINQIAKVVNTERSISKIELEKAMVEMRKIGSLYAGIKNNLLELISKIANQ